MALIVYERNEKREYQIKIYSISRFIIALVVILCSLSILTIDYLPQIENEVISTLQFLSIFIASFYLANLIGMAKVKVVYTDEAIFHIWERRFLLSWEKNIKIPWSIVDNYVFQEDRTFDSFIINLTNKTRYKINRLNLIPIKDDFESLVKHFPRLSNEYKNSINPSTETNPVKKGESIYESKHFKWIFYLMTIGFIILVLSKVLDPESETKWSSLGVIGSGLLFYWGIIKGQKNN